MTELQIRTSARTELVDVTGPVREALVGATGGIWAIAVAGDVAAAFERPIDENGPDRTVLASVT